MNNPIINFLQQLNKLYPPPAGCNHCFIENPVTGISSFHFWYRGEIYFCTIETAEDEQQLNQGTLIDATNTYLRDVDCDELIKTLKEIEANPEITSTKPEHDWDDEDNYVEEGKHPLVDRVRLLADTALITASGACYWENHSKLDDAGFPVRCGESDSFGWLSGVIKTSKGDIVYG